MTNTVPPPAEAYKSTLHHIDLLDAKRMNLTYAQARAEEQVIHRVSVDYRAGRIDVEGVLDVYEYLKPRAVEGFPARWNVHMPDDAKTRTIRSTVYRKRRFAPDEDGVWRGAYPFGDTDRHPPTGKSVVYVLFDDANEPCYVGSTADFRGRCKAHRKEGKPFVRWMAYPCINRAAAYDLEVRLLHEHMPYLNRKVGR